MPIKTKRLIAVALAGLAYLVAVTQRTTMGSVALDAAERFDTNARELASLAVLQLIFYAGMQIPVGILLDRFGSRKLLTSGAILMAVGQFLVAASETLPSAVVGRIFVGIGDACTFISMMRLSNSWFTGKLASQLQQWLATIGQSGQILSAIPFAFLLHAAGWSTAFASAAAVSLLVAVLVWLLAKENPRTTNESIPLTTVLSNLRKNLRVPTTWLAFFTHFSTQSTGTSFALLWGVPFMVSGVGLPRAVAGILLTVFVVTNATMGPVIGYFCARFPQLRQRFVLLLVTSILVAWIVVVLTPGPTPLWMLAALVIVIGVGGPSSMVAFDYSKERFPTNELGATNGVINVGGFLAALTMIFLIGTTLDILGGENLYSMDNFRVAFSVQLIITVIGIVGLLASRLALRNNRGGISV